MALPCPGCQMRQVFANSYRHRGAEMIARTWRGWTRLEDAARYESVFRTIVLPHLDNVEGCRQAFLFRRNVNDEVEFFVLTLFDSMDAVSRFAGENYEAAVV